MSFRSLNRSGLRYSALAVALMAGMTGVAFGQATTGNIAGQAEPGDTVSITSASGLNRQVAVDASGRYSANNLPVGTYTVSVQKGGTTVDTRKDVTLKVGATTEVSFASASNASSLSAVTVTANSLPAIDVSGVDSRTVITAQQLARLPLARSAEAIALLAPGVVQGSGYFTGPLGNSLVSIGGSSVTENAYYINGFNTTDPLSGFGGVTLPYGAIEQQEVLQGGYGAAYGRSDGGVISQVGKRGTNEWHFGGQYLWTPAFAKSHQDDYYYVTGSKAGKIYRRNEQNRSWTATADAYVGGPLIKDKLYFFAAVEGEKSKDNVVGNVTSPFNTKETYTRPKTYVKLDWNINDSNILELTGISNKTSYSASNFNYDYNTHTTGAFASYATSTKTSAKDYIVKYTSYITDDLTATVQYGKQKLTYFTITPGYDPTLPNVFGTQNPALLPGGAPIANAQTAANITNPDHKSTNTNFRFDVTYKLGSHTISAGIDNQDSHDIDDGTAMTGPGYAWDYGFGDPTKPISDNPHVDAPGLYPNGSTGYYVSKYIFTNSASVRVKQRAQYVEDAWQINDRWLVKVGLRNDQFTNYNPAGEPFLRLTRPQWAPRLGFAWDVNGDSSFKVYGNAGRYYLAMPASVALRAAGASVYTNQYYTYSGINAQGIPTGLTAINSATGGPVSANNEYGQPVDPKEVAARNIRSEYQDEYMLGFDKQFNAEWTYGAKATVRKLKTGLDDICDPGTISAKADSLGLVYDPNSLQGCYLSNPGHTNIYRIADGKGGYVEVPVSAKDFGDSPMKRNYYALNAYLEHPFDGKWQARVDYTYSRSYGNSEGQVRSDIGQTDVSATVDWDYGTLMNYANGLLANDRKHQIKAYGSYQINPEWMVAANIQILSGTPRSCLGYYGADESDPAGYGSYYHYCGGKPSRPGDMGRNPWQEILSLNAEYRPAFADHKLAFNVFVYNVFDQQHVTQTYPRYGYAAAQNINYGRPLFTTTPRYVRFGVTYDF